MIFFCGHFLIAMINSLYSIFSTWFLFLYTSVHIINGVLNSSMGFVYSVTYLVLLALEICTKVMGFFFVFFSFWIDFSFSISTNVSTWFFSWFFATIFRNEFFLIFRNEFFLISCNELPTKNVDDFEFKTKTLHILLFRTFVTQEGGSYLVSNAQKCERPKCARVCIFVKFENGSILLAFLNQKYWGQGCFRVKNGPW